MAVTSSSPPSSPDNSSDQKQSDNTGYVNNGFVKDTVNGNSSLSLSTTTTATISDNNSLNNKKNNDEKNSMKEPVMDFDDLLPHIGEFGRYQKILFLCMIPFAFFVAFVYFSQIFITLVPEEHWCNVPELADLSVEERLNYAIPKDAEGNYHKCLMYAVNFTEMREKGLPSDPHWKMISCRNGWEYNFTDIPYATVATELNWVCEDSYLPTLSQSVFFLGAIVGGLLFGWIADRYGRIPSLALCNLVGFAAGVATVFSTSFWMFALCRFLVGFAFDNCFTMMYILVLEYVGPRWRTFVANMSIAIFFTMASCALPWIAYYLADWRMFTIVTSVPLALAIFTPWVVPESARWLVSQGKTDKAMKILKKFEKVNRTTVDPNIYKQFQASCDAIQKEEAENANYSIFDLFKTPRLRNNTILLIVIWMAISLVFDGHVRNVGQLGLDLFVTFTVACATELPADTFLTLTLDRWGRRWLAFGTMAASGIFSLLATTVPVGIYSATLAILGRFSVNISYNIGLQYAAELLPTVVRAQGVAFIHIMGYVASIVAPFVVYLANISQSLPLIVLGVLGIFGGVLSLFLPETLGQELPQNLTDGEEFGKNQKMWSFPCISKKLDDEEDNECSFKRSNTSPHQTHTHGASLRASTRGELSSYMLRRMSSSGSSSNGTENGLNLSNGEEIVDFDDLIHHFGDCGRYQMLLFVLMIPFICFIAFVFYSQFFITLVPEHYWCRVPDLETLSVHERQLLAIPSVDGEFDRCSMYNVDFIAEIRKGVTVGNASWPRQKCIYGYEYDHSVIPFTTIATEMNWVCEFSYFPNLAQSIYYMGSICGGLLFGYISDNYGRIPALVGCNLIGSIFGSLTIFSTNFWTFALCRFFVGFAFDGCFAMMYILVVEYVGPKWRTFVCNISLGIFFASMTAALPWIVLYIGDWKIFTLMTSLPLMLAILTPLIVPESVRWLATKGKVERIIKIMKKIERTNKKNVGLGVYENIRKTCAVMQKSEAASKNYTFFDLFRMPQLRTNTIILIIVWMIIALSFDAHARNIDSLGLNLFLTFSLACAAEFPADVLLVLTIDRWGRRFTSATALVLGGILNLTATIVPFGPISATLAILGRLTINYSYNLGIQYTAELIPTVVRGQGVTFIHIMGFVAAIFAPFVVYLKNFATVLPLIVVGVLGLIGGSLCLFLPETLNRELPQSLDDGEAFNKAGSSKEKNQLNSRINLTSFVMADQEKENFETNAEDSRNKFNVNVKDFPSKNNNNIIELNDETKTTINSSNHEIAVNGGSHLNNKSSSENNFKILKNDDEHFIIMDFDQFLPYVGDCGRYQALIFIVMIPFCFFFAVVYFAQMFITLVPNKYYCNVPELNNFNLTEEQRITISIPFGPDDGEINRCQRYDVNFKEIIEQGITEPNRSWPVKNCDNGYIYDFSDIPYETIATELNWVCDQAFLPNLAQSIFYVGAIVGGFFFGWVSDHYGRVPALVGCTMVGGVAGIVTIYVKDFWSFAICRFFVGFAYDNVYTMIYILIIEYTGVKWRTYIANLSIAVFFTIAACALPFLALYLLDWRQFAIITSAPLLLAIFTPYVVPESARWLVSQGKIDRAIKIMKHIAEMNKKEVDQSLYDRFEESCSAIRKNEESHKSYSMLDLFKMPRIRNITILLIIMWMTISLVFDGHARNVGSLGMDLFFTHTVGTATELPSDLLLIFMIDYWGRRWPSVGALVIGGIFSLFAAVVPFGAYSATLAILGRATANFSYNLGCQYAAELLPTVVRGQGITLIHIMGYVASLIAPFVVYLANFSTSLPLIVLGIVGIVGGLFCLFLPESLNCELPQTMEDGEEFGKDQTFWSFPCCGEFKINNNVNQSITTELSANLYRELKKKNKLVIFILFFFCNFFFKAFTSKSSLIHFLILFPFFLQFEIFAGRQLFINLAFRHWWREWCVHPLGPINRLRRLINFSIFLTRFLILIMSHPISS
uniref:CSON009535 protein n=1 Tax=Culicoides sonorensis TaxID=179676 RepID=A0A336K3J5_CULSO